MPSKSYKLVGGIFINKISLSFKEKVIVINFQNKLPALLFNATNKKMIVNYTESGWRVVTQRSHGLLAAQVCAHWKKDNQPARWVETLIATAEHDDVYNELENDDLLNGNGGPVDFKHRDFDKSYSERLMAMAETKSAYIALLTARHIRFVYGDDPKARTFISNLQKREKLWLDASGCAKDEVDRGYELLEFCDAFSLLICQEMIQPEQRKIEISNGPDQKAYEMHSVGGLLVIEPWPFESESFSVCWESRAIAELKFKNVAAFRQAFQQAEVTTHWLTLAKG